MLCSVPPGSGTKSTCPNWLDRLRHNKGFFSDDTSPEPTQSADPHRLTSTTNQPLTAAAINEESVLINILSDLFNTGPHLKPSKKASRKQANPKPLFPRQKDLNALLATSTSSNENNGNCITRSNDGDYGDDCETAGEMDFKGFSRSEVTVIDTSCEVWKSDRLVFRKESVWRVREKKGRTGPWKGRKRKRSEGEKLGFSEKKKEKGSSSGSMELSESQKPEDVSREDFCKEMADVLGQGPKKRLRLCRSPRELKESTSTVVLIKASPTSKKLGTNVPKNRTKETAKQPKGYKPLT